MTTAFRRLRVAGTQLLVPTVAPFLLLAPHFARAQTPPATEPAPPTPVVQLDFETGDLEGWYFTDPSAWRITKLGDGHHVLEQHKASQYEPAVRSPLNIALVPEADLTDLDLVVKVRSTGRDYGHRDVCLFFGYQDPSHFYYVHLGKEADPHAHSIFLVNGEPRVSIAEERTKGTPWTDEWHVVRIVRKVDDGSILVYFDDLKTPIMTAHDKTFTHGRIGVGSFDDTGMFDQLSVFGTRTAP